jgi:hypothetical protein
MPEMLGHAWLKDAVASGRAGIAEKLKQKAEAKLVHEANPAAVNASSTKPAAETTYAAKPTADHPEIQPRVEGVGTKGFAGSCGCTIS